MLAICYDIIISYPKDEIKSMTSLPDNKVIITAAFTGAWPLVTKALNPAVPEQPEEIAEAARACYREGAAICHIHARDKEGKSTGSKEDNLYLRKGQLAQSNAQRVARTVRIARELNKEPAKPEEAREILGIMA